MDRIPAEMTAHEAPATEPGGALKDMQAEIDELRRKLNEAHGDRDAERKLRVDIETAVKNASSKELGLLQAKLLNWEKFEFPMLDEMGNPIPHPKTGEPGVAEFKIDYSRPVYWVQGAKTDPKTGSYDPINGLVRSMFDGRLWRYLMFREGCALTNDLEEARKVLRDGTVYSIQQLKIPNAPKSAPLTI